MLKLIVFSEHFGLLLPVKHFAKYFPFSVQKIEYKITSNVARNGLQIGALFLYT